MENFDMRQRIYLVTYDLYNIPSDCYSTFSDCITSAYNDYCEVLGSTLLIATNDSAAKIRNNIVQNVVAKRDSKELPGTVTKAFDIMVCRYDVDYAHSNFTYSKKASIILPWLKKHHL